MKKLAKILFGVNSLTTIFIGILHTIAHYSDLITEEIHNRLDFTAVVTGMESNIWELYQGMSLMMGYLMIIIGLLNFSIIFRLKKEEYPPISASLIFIVMLLGVIYVGANYFSSWQVYGGIGGILLQSIVLVLSMKGNNINQSTGNYLMLSHK